MANLIDEIKNAITVAHITPDRIHSAVEYLKKYGYLIKSEDLSIKDVVTAIEQFRTFFNLRPEADLLTPAVLRVMDMPRCGHPDILPVTNSPKWGLNNLTYFIVNRVPGFPTADWDAIVAQAFANWAAVCGLTFAPATSSANANLIIDVGQGSRDDFTSQSILAWAQLPGSPGYNGQLLMKFNIDENWIENPTTPGILLENVACHEFGHFLGLTHSSVQTALMAPFYSPSITKPQSNDDIPRIQSLYGAASAPTPPPVPVPTSGGSGIQLTLTVPDLQSLQIHGPNGETYRILKM